MGNTFKKAEKLKSKKIISSLFDGGEKMKHFPLLMVYTQCSLLENVSIQAGFSVSKRRFKNAVDRNRIKRQMREAYRLQKPFLKISEPQQFAVLFIYIHHQKLPFSQIEEAMKQCLKQLATSN